MDRRIVFFILITFARDYESVSNTTNFATHLDNFHKDVRKSSDVLIQSQKQSTIKQCFTATTEKPLPAPKKAEVEDALLKFVVGKVLPLSTVESSFFKDFVHGLNPRYTPPNKRVIQKLLDKKKEEITLKIRADMKDQHLAITHDGWTSLNTESYSTVTGHFITDEWVLKSVVLETAKVEGSHTGENIMNNLLQVQAAWNFKNPISVTDNAANERKAFDLLKWTRVGCFGHRINLVVRNAMAIPEVSKIVGKGRKLVTFFHQSSSATDILMAKQELISPELNGHKLINDVCTRWNSTFSMLERLLELCPAIMATVGDCRLSKQASCTLQNYVYSFEEQAVVEKLVKVLEPFKDATNSLSGDKFPTLHKVIPVLVKLERVLERAPDDSQLLLKVKDKLSTELADRTQDKEILFVACMLNPATKSLSFLSEEEQCYGHDLLLQYALQMKVKLEPNQQNTSVASEAAQPPLPPLPDLNINNNVVTPSTSSTSNQVKNQPSETSDSQGPSPAKKRTMGLDDWLQDVVCTGVSRQPTQDLIRQEVARYLAIQLEDSNMSVLEWWAKHGQEYPRLSSLAKKYLCVPASSVPAERVFSLAGQIVSKKRARLDPENVDTLIFLNKNMTEYW